MTFDELFHQATGFSDGPFPYQRPVWDSSASVLHVPPGRELG